MARPQRSRRICKMPEHNCFSPEGSTDKDVVILSLDEYETIRLVDLEKQTHEQCAAYMDISRTTVTEIYESARSKLADCIVNGKQLIISGGNYHLCDGAFLPCQKRSCCQKADTKNISLSNIQQKGNNIMRIAVTYENGFIFQHFGHTKQFKIYDISDRKITNSAIIDTNGSGHGALAGLLAEHQIDILICGGIGGGAQTALAEAGIKLYGGVSGEADKAVEMLLANELAYDPDVQCNHHGEHHGNCGNHSCESN